jgi:hypothetical protein
MKTAILLIILILPNWLFSQQIADTSYNPVIKDPAYSTGIGPVVFIDEGTLIESIITKGRDSTESVEQIVTFTGQGFEIPDNATPILLFDENYMNVLPDTAWVFDEETPQYNINGWSQGAYKKYGKGKVVVFGEAAMCTAQLAGAAKIKAGMNTEIAKENYRLLLNIIHWLDGKLD